jgi:hypothetical protein
VRHVTARWIGWTVAAALGLLGCSGHGSGGPGDPLASPQGDVYGSGSRVSELLGPASWFAPTNEDSTGCAYPLERPVLVSGATITAVDRYDETGDGSVGNIYVQDSFAVPVPFSGLTVYNPGFSPPDMRVMPDDVVDVLGVLQEFPGPSAGYFARCVSLPEMGGSMSFRFEDAGIQPTAIQIRDLASYPTARQWLGMLVTVQNVMLTADAKNSSGCVERCRYSAPLDVGGGVEQRDVPTITNELFDLEHAGLTLTEGTTLSSVTGIVTYFYGTHLSPRSADDIVP